MKKEQENIDPKRAARWLKAIIAVLSAILDSITGFARIVRIRR